MRVLLIGALVVHKLRNHPRFAFLIPVLTVLAHFLAHALHVPHGH